MKMQVSIISILILIASFTYCNNPHVLNEEENYIITDNGKIWFRIIGSGSETPILALHGGPGGKSRYFYPLSPISEERPLILFDQLGSGKSDHHQDTSLLQIDNFISQVKLVKDEIGLENFYLLGQSWGSALALEYYLKHPEGIKGLIFSGPYFSTELWEKDADILISSLSDSIQGIISEAEMSENFDTPEYRFADSVYWSKFGRRNPWPLHPLDDGKAESNKFIYKYMWGPSEFTALGTLKNYDNHQNLSRIKIPTLFIAGEFDEARSSTVRYFQSLVPGSEMAIIKNAGHSSMTDNPKQYLKELSPFISKIE
ncbi:proline iminopeptidase-family hydrolase [Hyphobacterium sp. CCMP332]|nr:proline iminopeptidase-family hydrolase [Hyphobacterium sp. CCMP332]